MAAAGSSSSARNAPYGTRKNCLKLLIDTNVIQPMNPVYYKSKNGRAKEGRITSDGIACNCCGQIFTLTGFEAHAGYKKNRPSTNIFLEDGRSIADCQLELKPNNAGSPELANEDGEVHGEVQEGFRLFGKLIIP